MTAATTKRKAQKKATPSTQQRRASATATTMLVVAYNPRMTDGDTISERVKGMHGVTAVRTH